MKDLAKLQSNINLVRLLKAKEETKRVEFSELRAKGFHLPAIVESLNITSENKKCHLWLTGPPNSGKTYFVERMSDLGIQTY